MPESTKFIDSMREFDLSWIHATENGHEIEWGEGFGDYVVLPLTSQGMKKGKR